MLKATWRKIRADIRTRRIQTALVFLVVAAAAATLSLALNVNASAASPYERLRERSNGADAWFNLAGGQSTDEVSSLPGVTHVGEPYPVSWDNYGIRTGDTKQQFAIAGLGPTLAEFDHPVVTAGRWLADGGTSEMVMDPGAADLLDVDVGDSVELFTPAAGTQRFTVVGFAATAGRAPAPANDPAFAYVLPETLQRVTPGAVFGADDNHVMRVGVTLTPGYDPVRLFEAANATLGHFSLRTAVSVEQNIEETNQFDVIFLQVFSFFALLAAGMIVANAVGGQVLSQLHDLGVMKSIGFTPRQVTMALLLENSAVALSAAIVGAAGGYLLSPLLLRRTADVLGVPPNSAFNPAVLITSVVTVVLIAALFTLIPAWRAGRINTVAALTISPDPRGSGVSRLASLATALRLPRPVVIGVKDLTRRPGRTAMTLLALTLAVVTATFSLGIEATFSKTMDDPTVIGGPPFSVAADRDTVPDDEARRIFAADPDITGVVPFVHTSGRFENQGFDVWALEGQYASYPWALREGRLAESPGEATISTELARERGWHVGDRVTVFIGDNEGTAMDVTVTGIVVSAEGAHMMLPSEDAGLGEAPTDYLIAIREGAEPRAVGDRLIAASGGQLDVQILSETIAGIRDQWRPLLLGLNLVLLLIAGINLLANLLLGIRERLRDFAILKTIGFTPGQVAGSVVGGSAVLALASLGVGLPMGLIATRVMFDVLSNAAGIGSGVGALPGPLWLLPIVPVVLAVAAVTSGIPARAAGRLRIAEALRYE